MASVISATAVVDGHPVLLGPVAVAEGDRAGGGVLATGDQDVGHLGLLGVPDLLAHPVVGGVDLDPYAGGAQPGRHLVQVVLVLRRHRDGDHLDRGQPRAGTRRRSARSARR